MSDITETLINQFGYNDLWSNYIVHEAVDEIKNLRQKVSDLEAEVSRLEKLQSF